MAQNECQRMDKTEFYQKLRNLLSTIYNLMNTADRGAEFLNTMDSDTLDTMGVPAVGADEGLRTTLSQCRTALNEFRDFYDGTATTQTQTLKTTINKLRHM